jgi:hypothetical protein
MKKLQVHDWDIWQSYRRDRGQPPWIKIHRRLMRDHKWIGLTDAQRGQLVNIWLLAADDDGRIPDDPGMVRKLCYLEAEPDLKLFIEKGFLDATLTPSRRQDDADVTHQNRIEKNRTEAASPRVVDKKAVRKNGTGFYVPTGSREWEAWKRHALKVHDDKLLFRLKNGGEEIHVPDRWPPR